MHREESIIRRFRVRVGHSEVSVEGRDAQDAIGRARTALSREMPRLYDVIYHMDPSRFDVTETN
jgi:hypothetical protein